MQPYDPTKPLDDDTRQRLLERNRWQEVEENDRRFASTEQVRAEPESPEEEPEEVEGDLEEDLDDPEDPNDLLKPELRSELDRRGIKYSRRALKSELIALLRQSEESDSSDEAE